MDDGKIRKENEFPKPEASGLGKELLSLGGGGGGIEFLVPKRLNTVDFPAKTVGNRD